MPDATRHHDPPPFIRALRVALALALLALGLWIAQGFLAPLAWAAILAVTVWPLYQRVGERLHQRGPSGLRALAFTLVIGLVLLLPLLYAALLAAREASAALTALAAGDLRGGLLPPDWLPRIPLIGGRVTRWWHDNLSGPDAPNRLLGQLDPGAVAAYAKLLASTVAGSIFVLLLALLSLFFLLRDGAILSAHLLGVSVLLLGRHGLRFADDLAASVRGTVIGTVFVALLEGAILGVFYVVAGVPEPFLFAAFTAAFAMLPLGAYIVFSVACLVLLAIGAIKAAALLFAVSAVVIAIGDNIVQPAMIGDRTRLPFLLAMVGTFGGLAALGLIGLFIGPVVMAALLLVWQEWVSRPPPPTGDDATDPS